MEVWVYGGQGSYSHTPIHFPFSFSEVTIVKLLDRIMERLRLFRGVMGIAAEHLRTRECLLVNAHQRFPAASVIKIPIMVEVYAQIAEGRLDLDDGLLLTDADKVGGSGVLQYLQAGIILPIRDLVMLMIIVSDNTAANLLLDRVGVTHVNRRMAACGLPSTKVFRKAFAEHPEVDPDEEAVYGFGVSTPYEMMRLLKRIACGDVIDPAACDAMVETMRRQQINLMLPRRLPFERDAVTIAHKTGESRMSRPDPSGLRRHVRNDVGIVDAPQGRYLICLFTQDVMDSRWLPENEALTTGADISRLIYDHFNPPSGTPR